MFAMPSSRKPVRRVLLVPVLLLSVLALPCRAAAAEYVWIEAEALPRPPAGFKVAGWGNKHYLSGESWLFASIDGPEAEKLPAEGLRLSFPFASRSGGQHEVWARVGYEFVRSPFRWRIDDGGWGADGPERLTTDLMDLAEWTEVAWVKLGTAALTPGKHTLEIQFDRRVLAGKERPERILAGLDCFCIFKGAFRPNGRFKPDEDYRDKIDREAGAQVFRLAVDVNKQYPLDGLWEIARFDEQEISDRDQPVKELPADYGQLFWKGVPVPGNRDTARPDMLYCHRFLYRTRIHVPANSKLRSYVLRFPSTALLASVFINGKYCGGSTTPCAAWDADVTAFLRPDQVNEVVVAIKDCYYAIAQTGEGKSARYLFNYPVNRFYNDGGLGATRFADFPVLFQVRGAGIFETPTLTVGGAVYVADVFVKPSVARKELGLEITLANPYTADLTVQVANEVIPVGGAAAEKTFAVKTLTVPGLSSRILKLTEPWVKPRLWWPDQPQLHEVYTRVSIGDSVVDLKKTRFGFREWGWSGKHFTLNGVPWHFRADLMHNGKLSKPAHAVADWKKSGINTVRYWGYQPWVGNSQEETLDFYDKVGMPVRRTGIFDGEVASYLLVENKGGKTVARKALFDHWIDQLRAWVKAERNHPSVFVWSIENEITYINIRNFGWLPACEPEIRRAIATVMALDPTRPAMIDGGDALTDRSLPIYGNHYNESHFREYPDEAYTMKIAYSRHQADPRRNPWPIGDDRPLFLGESFFASGHPPAAYAALMGEAAFLGRGPAEKGVRVFARMLAEGYRWHGIAGFHFWMAGDSPDNYHYKAFQPVCVLCREWNWTFGAGREVTRTLKVFNDTRHDNSIEVEWRFKVPLFDDLFLVQGKKAFVLKPGTAAEWPISLKTPQVLGGRRLAGELVLTCRVGGETMFRDVKPCAIVDADQVPLPALAAGDVAVLDPQGAVKARLKKRGIACTDVASFDVLPARARVLIVGPDALTARQATDPRWLALAASGTRVLVLDQEHPLHYQAVPADLEPTPHAGRIAFPENLGHPAFAGLASEDFFCWSGDHVVYRNAYKKASRGARSLLQCDDELSCTALAECPVRDGLLVLCQAVAGSRLDTDPVAQRLFDNLVNYCASYKPAARTTVAVLPAGDPRLKLLDAIGLRHTTTEDIVAAVANPKVEIVVADASPANLAKLVAAGDKLRGFTERGGTLMLWGLTPTGLADYNKLVGVKHVIRPFGMERVTLPAVRDPLIAGLTMRDVALESAERIYPWAGDRYPAKDTFTHVVDLDDIAPFATSKEYAHGWRQMTNGLTSADSWKFIFYHDLSKGDPHPKWTADLPREEEITDFAIILNTHYHLITKMKLIFDGNAATAVTLDLKPGAELRQDFPIPPRKCRQITLEPVAWEAVGKQPVIGVDNIWIKVRRDDAYRQRVVPLLNLGGLVKYQMGKGGIILNQLAIPASEANPVNVEKKQNVVATLLRNLGATFAAQRLLVAGANLKYTPVPLDEKCTQYLTSARGWIAGGRDLGHLPVGEQRFAGVAYVIRDFKTSPLPACIMLAGPGVKGAMPKSVEGIPVGRKADVLFFLHTFHRTREWRPPGGKNQPTPPAVFEYVITYADGKTVVVPVRYERGVGHWIAEEPHGLPEAAVAWAAPFPDDAKRQAVVYQMAWTNPRPEEAIRSIAVRYNEIDGSHGVPVVLAITTAAAEP